LFSRHSNVYANREGIFGNPDNKPAIPLYQTTPQGVNRNNNVCGMDQGWPDNDYDLWLDTQGNPMPWISQATYNPGDTIQVDIFLTAHHKGHFEIKGCPLGRESSQECFDAYPLEFVEDLLYGMPKDPANPSRGYLHGTEPRLKMQFKLPAGLVGEQVLLQVRTVHMIQSTSSYRSFYDCISLLNVILLSHSGFIGPPTLATLSDTKITFRLPNPKDPPDPIGTAC